MIVWIQNPFDNLPCEGYRKQRYWMMSEAFVAAGHRVVLWTSDFSHATKKKRAVGGEKLTAAGGGAFEVRLIPTLPYSRNVCWTRVRSHRAYAQGWERLAAESVRNGELQKPDVLIVSAPPVATGAAAIRLARQFGARLVVDVQDAWPETFYRLLPRGLGWAGDLLFASMRRDMRRLYRAADLVTGVCDRYEGLVRGYGAKRYFRAYLGIEGGRAADGRREPEGNGPLRLAYVGNLGASYDLKTVVAGVRLLNAERGGGVTLDVAGFGGTVPKDAAVRFHGMLGQEDLRELLANCDVGVIPMKSDSFVGIPNKLCEYAAAGLRVVSSLEGETAALIERYGCGATYRWGDAASLAAAVRRAVAASSSQSMCAREFDARNIYSDYVTAVLGGGVA